jgi:hypothetical protein
MATLVAGQACRNIRNRSRLARMASSVWGSGRGARVRRYLDLDLGAERRGNRRGRIRRRWQAGGAGRAGCSRADEHRPAGNLLIADATNNRVRVLATTTGTFCGQVMTAGDNHTVAGNGRLGFSGDGGPAVSGSLFFPAAAAADGAGRVLIADTYNNRVRLVSPAAAATAPAQPGGAQPSQAGRASL